MHKDKPNNTGHVARTIAAIILTFIGIVGSIQLLRSQLITEVPFTTLSMAAAFFGCVIAFIDRVQSFGSAAFRVELAQVQEARKEVEARALEIRRVTFALAEITLFITAIQGRIRSEGEADVNTPWLESKVREILHSVSATPEEQSKTFRLFSAAKEMDRLHGQLDATEWEKGWNAIKEQISNETKQMV